MKLTSLLFAMVACVCVFFSSAVYVPPVFATSTPESGLTRTTLTNPIANAGQSGATDIRILFGRILQQALAVIGSLALLMFIIGGAYWLVSAGNADRVKKGTETMLWAVIGLFVVFGAYGILGTVISGLTGKSLGEAGTPTAIPDGETTPVNIVYYSFEGENVPIRKDAVGTSPSVSLKALSGVINCLAGSDQHLFGYTRVEDPNNKGSFGWVEDKYLKQNASCGIKKLPASNDAYAPKSASATACGCYGSVEIKTKGLASLLAGDCTMSIDKTNKVQIPYGTKTNSQNVLKLVLEKGPQDCRDLIKHLDKLPNTDLTVDAYGCEQALPNILSQYSQYKSDFADVTHTLTCEPL